MDAAALLGRRRSNFRQLETRRVKSAKGALAFVDAVGLCSTFYVFPEGVGCLWEAVVGRPAPGGRAARTTTRASASPGS